MTINELKIKRSDITKQIDGLLAVELTDESRSQVTNLENEYEKLSKDIEMLENQAKRAHSVDNTVVTENRTETKSPGAEFRDYLKAGNFTKPFVIERADPIVTSTDSGVINKTVANEVMIAMSPAESFLRNDLGVKIYENLNGNFVVPRMDQFSATFVNEASTATLGDVNLKSLTLAGRRLTAYATITEETLAQTNPAIFQGVIDDLKNSFWQGVKYDTFDQIEVDAATRISDQDAATMTYDVIVGMEASLGGVVPSQNLKLVATPTIKGFAKKTIALGTTAGQSIWEKIEYPKFDSDGANADRVYLGDFGKVVVGLFGSGYEVKILQDVDGAKDGIYTAVISGIVDTGCALPTAFVIADVSAGL